MDWTRRTHVVLHSHCKNMFYLTSNLSDSLIIKGEFQILFLDLNIIHELRHDKPCFFVYAKTKVLINAFVSAKI